MVSISYHVHFPDTNVLPSKVYRYFTLESYHQEALTNSQLWFNDPDKFNDPYEPFIHFNGNPRFEEAIKTDLQKSAVICFSRSPENFFLWSYYSNGLTGICVEYDTNILIKSLIENFESNQWLYSFDVQYKKSNEDHYGEIPVVEEERLISTDYKIKGPELLKIFATKPSFFKSENEFRIVVHPSVKSPESMCGLFNFNFEAITSCYLGAKTSIDHVDFCKKTFSDNVKFYQADTSKNYYKIEVTEI